MDDKYQILAKKFIREYYTYPNDQFDAILDFSKWLDSQEKSGGKEKIEELDWEDNEPYKIMRVDEWLPKFIEIKDKINEIIDFFNAEK